jgi:hypothetical protein
MMAVPFEATPDGEVFNAFARDRPNGTLEEAFPRPIVG